MPRGTSPSPRPLPRLTRHKASGRAVVRLGGRDYYCGRWGTQAAQREYDRLIAVYLAHDRCMPSDRPSSSIVEVMAAYMRWARTYYRKNGQPTSEFPLLKVAFRPLRQLYGRELAA